MRTLDGYNLTSSYEWVEDMADYRGDASLFRPSDFDLVDDGQSAARGTIGHNAVYTIPSTP